jgi:nucleoside-diphosphate-sugar epimerase
MNNQINIIGCGYIGQLVALELIQQQLKSVAYVKTEHSLSVCQQKHINTVQLDLDSVLSLIEVKNEKILYLIPPNPEGNKDNRIKNFINAIQVQPPKKIVLISTTGVYGDCAGNWVDETSSVKPDAPRAKRRADAEQQLIDYCELNHVSWVILRVPGIYGPGKLPVKRIKSGEAIVQEQDSPYSNRIHAYDLVNICIEAILSDNIEGIYNCSDGHPTTMHDYFIKVSDALQIKRPPSISLQQATQELSEGMLSYMAESRRVDNKKLLRDFELTLMYPDLDSGLRMIVNSIQ